MKSTHSTTSNPVEPSLHELSQWYHRLHLLHLRVGPRFARPEVRQRVLLYLQAILSDLPRKNGWQIAEQARQASPDGMQRLLSRAVWDENGVRDDLRTLVRQSLLPPFPLPTAAEEASPFPVLVLDESGFPKRGRSSPGVAPQYCGRTGRVENCQVGVFASYVTDLGHALIDRELYLPEDWCADLPRRQAAHIPDHVSFATKPELARRMVQRAQQAQLPIRWVVADTSTATVLSCGIGCRSKATPTCWPFLPPKRSACRHARVISCCAMSLLSHTRPCMPAIGTAFRKVLGTKGERLFDWARLPVAHAGQRRWPNIGSWCVAASTIPA